MSLISGLFKTIRELPAYKTLQRLSLVRWFDEELYTLLTRDVEAATFDEVRDNFFVEPVPDSEGTYRVRSMLRPVLLRSLSGPDKEEERAAIRFDELSRTLTRYFYKLGRRKHSRSARLEGLYHMLVVDQELAFDRFERMYKEADRDFDIALCRELLNILEERVPFVGQSGKELAAEFGRRLRARTYWSRSQRESARFVEFPHVTAAFRELMKPRGPRLLQITGPAGVGKSTQLRWLIAHECVPDGYPCALVDFQRVRADRACEDPWLVILDVSRQLEEQVDGQFHSMLRDYGPLVGVLRGEERGTAMPEGEERDHMHRDAVARFAEALRIVNRPICIFLDTFEQITRRRAEEVEGFTDELLRMLEATDSVRIVVAGREDIRNVLNQDAFQQFGRLTAKLFMEGFSRPDADRYLRVERGIEDEAVRDALIEYCTEGGHILPERLSQAADAVAAQRKSAEGFEPAQDYRPDAAQGLLLERVLDQVPASLKWTVSYAAVARRLTADVFRRVMWQERPSAQPGEDAPAVWKELCAFASGGLLRYAAGPPQRVTVRPDLLGPLRKRLASDETAQRLHKRAAEYFQALADEEPGTAPEAASRRIEHLREVIFHRFQARGADAASSWRDLVRGAKTGREAVELAREILGPEYADFAADLKVEALFESAQARLRTAEALVVGGRGLGRQRVRLAERAESELDEVLHMEAPENLHKEARRLQSRALSLQGREESARVLETPGDPAEAEDVVARAEKEARALRWLAPTKQTRAARDALEKAMENVDPKEHPRLYVSAVWRLSRLDARLGCFESAHRRIVDARKTISMTPGFKLLLDSAQAGTLATCGRPAEARGIERLDKTQSPTLINAYSLSGNAREALERLTVLGESSSRRRRPHFRQPLILELAGDAHARLFEASEAMAKYEEAVAAWNDLGDMASMVRAHLHAADLHFHVTGNLRSVRRHVDMAARRSEVAQQADLATRLRVALLHDALGDGAAARRTLDAVLESFQGMDRPQELAVFCCAALKLRATGDMRRYADTLYEALSAIDDPFARLRPLQRLASAPNGPQPTITDAPRNLVEIVSKTQAAIHAAESADDRDKLRAFLLLACWWRATGDVQNARAAIEEAWGRCEGPEDELYRQVYVMAQRLDFDDVIPEETFGRFRREFEDRGLVVVQAELKGIERGIRAGQLPSESDLHSLWKRLRSAGFATLMRSRVEALMSDTMGRSDRQVYESGWDLRAEATRRKLGRPADGEGKAASAHADDAAAPREVVLSLDNDGLRSTYGRSDGSDVVTPAWLEDLVRRESAQSRELFSAERLRDLIPEWRNTAMGLADAVFEPSPPKDDQVWRLRITHDRLHLLALEAGRLLQNDTRLIYRWESEERMEFENAARAQRMLNDVCLHPEHEPLAVDGIFGPISKSRLKEWQRQEDLVETDTLEPAWREIHRRWRAWRDQGEPRRVLAVTCAQYVTRSLYSARPPGSEFDAAYENNGYRVTRHADPDLRDLADVLEHIDPAIVHIECAFSDRRGHVTLDFGRDSEDRRPISVTALHHVLQGAPHSNGPPLIVLDALRPPGGFELARQMCLRNYFAGDLFGLGSAGAILATGLMPDSLLKDYYQCVAHGAKVGAGAMTRDLWTMLQQYNVEGSVDEERLTGLLSVLYAASERMAW